MLNWSRFPFILSGDLTIGYSAQFAAKKQEWLRTLSVGLKETIDQEGGVTGGLVLPLLAFPACPPDDNLSPFLETDRQRDLYNRAVELQQQFDTVIGMPFDSPNEAWMNARAQLAQLQPAILLFAPGLSELTIRIAGESLKHWRKDPDINGLSRVWIGNEAETCLEWRVVVERDRLTSEHLSEPSEPLGYEAVIAVPVIILLNLDSFTRISRRKFASLTE